MSRIFIVGSGAVGSATGLDLVRAGHQVTFVDDSHARVAALVGQGLDARPELTLDGEPEAFIFLCLPTPNDGRGYDLAAIENGATQVGQALARADTRHIVVIRSTVPPGTTRELVRPLLERHSGKRDGVGFGLAASPDFRRTSRPVPGPTDQGRTEHGLPIRGLFEERQGAAGPRMTVIGARSQRVAHRLGDLLGPLGGQVRVFDDPATAELIKCTSSLFNATKISFWNEIWGVCDQLGLDPDQVADTVASSAQGSIDPAYGLRGGAPYGGAQLPGDTGGFLGFAAELGIPMPLLSAVVGVNNAFEQRLAAELDGASAISAIPRSRSEPRVQASEADVGETPVGEAQLDKAQFNDDQFDDDQFDEAQLSEDQAGEGQPEDAQPNGSRPNGSHPNGPHPDTDCPGVARPAAARPGAGPAEPDITNLAGAADPRPPSTLRIPRQLRR